MGEAGGGRREREEVGSLGKLVKNHSVKKRGEVNQAQPQPQPQPRGKLRTPVMEEKRGELQAKKEKRSEYASSLLLRHSFCATSPLTTAKTNPT
jgi:hypothetical protein